MLAALLLWPTCMRGQESSDESHDTGYTVEQTDALDRVRELVGRLQAMQWGPHIATALSSLGAATCRYNPEVGIEAFEAAYAVVAGLEFDQDDDPSMRTLSRLAIAASQCHLGFRSRPLTRQVPADDLRARGLLDAFSESVESNPQRAVELSDDVVRLVHRLPDYRQIEFVRALWKLRERLPAAADGLFRDALATVASSGTAFDLLTLGNYVLGPDIPMEGAVATTTLSGGRAYLLSTVRPGLSRALVRPLVATATELLLAGGTPNMHDTESLALAIQLAPWAKTSASEYSPALDGLLASQTTTAGIRQELSDYREQIGESTSLQASEEDLGAALNSVADEERRSRISLELWMNRLDQGEFEQATEFLDYLSPELRPILRDLISLQRAIEAITGGRLDHAARDVAGLRDNLYQVFGALSLANAYQNRSRERATGSEEDLAAMDRNLYHASGAVEGVPGRLRPHARIAVAAIQVNCDRGEDALRMLELAVQELGSDPLARHSGKKQPAFLVIPRPWGGFGVEITNGDSRFVQDIHPPALDGASFEHTLHQLASSPGVDLDRLDAISSAAIDPRMRAAGLVSVATGALSRAFADGADWSWADRPTEYAGSTGTSAVQGAGQGRSPGPR